MTTLPYNEPTGKPGFFSRPGGKWLACLALLAGAAVLAAGPLRQWTQALQTTATPVPAATDTVQAPIQEEQEKIAARARSKPREEETIVSRPTSQSWRLPQTDEQARARAKQTEYAAGLIDWLQEIISTDGVITAAEAQAVHQVMQRIISQGPAAVPAIRQFLQSQEDFIFHGAEGGNFFDYRSLRIALMEALGAIGGPEAENILFGLLETTAEPAEVATLADILENQAPGYYHDSILQAARRSLAIVSQGPSAYDSSLAGERTDAAPLFEVFQKHGDATTVAELERAMGQWGYYATLTLANLPDGQGIPTLALMVQNPAIANSEQGRLALQLLVQAATDNPIARDVLLDRVRADAIPDSFWPRLADVVAGDYQVQMEMPDPSVQPIGSALKQSSYSTQTVVGNQNQVIYSVHRSGVLSPEEYYRRVDLLDQLAEETSNPIALQALRGAESLLGGQRH